jgi:hypothetical protein
MGLGRIRLLLGIAVAVPIAWGLHIIGWPWYAYVPAAILAGLSTLMMWLVAWYVARKITYPRNADRQHRLLDAAHRQTMAAASSDGRNDTEQGACGDGG